MMLHCLIIVFKSWGNKVYRLSFTAKKLAAKGAYSFSIKKQ